MSNRSTSISRKRVRDSDLVCIWASRTNERKSRGQNDISISVFTSSLFRSDYKSGFGGGYGVQSDRMDQSALGWDYYQKPENHASQRGNHKQQSKYILLETLFKGRGMFALWGRFYFCAFTVFREYSCTYILQTIVYLPKVRSREDTISRKERLQDIKMTAFSHIHSCMCMHDFGQPLRKAIFKQILPHYSFL